MKALMKRFQISSDYNLIPAPLFLFIDNAHASDNRLRRVFFLSKAVIIYLAMQNKIMFGKEIVYALLMTCLLSIKNLSRPKQYAAFICIYSV